MPADAGVTGVEGVDHGASEQGAEGTHDRLGRALTDLLENPLVTGTISRALGARERAAQAQELWMGALNLPSAADIERLTRRLRSVSQRLEGVEDGVQYLGRSLVQGTGIEARLSAIEERLGDIGERLAGVERRLGTIELLMADKNGLGSPSEGRGTEAGTVGRHDLPR
jgi:hypothetical protein